ncbi:MAG: hypothetical protein OXI67_06560 [Candidatus Poribacteria bacterium]|nr:hypothetical protein [Candidatus Poribacteria bacterium]
MIRLRSIGIAVAMICSLLLTPTVFAQLATDNHAAEDIDASVSVSIDSLSYDSSGAGVAYLSGSFFVYNYHTSKKLFYNGELRLEILEPKGDGTYFTFSPDSKENVSGNLKKNDEDSYIGDVYDSFSKSTSSYMDCLSGGRDGGKPVADREYTMSAAITLNATIGRTTETWAVNNPTLKIDFTHNPETDEDEISGIGPTTDGETFSDDCTCNLNSERDWQSLVITDTPYSSVYWYVKAPGDTSSLGTHVETDWGDGAEKRATMTYSFPDDVGGPGEEAAYYEITAYYYLSDNTVNWESYKVYVHDK